MKLAIAVPTYNEAANLKKLLPAIHKSTDSYPNLKCTVFIIDDNSPDGTAGVAQKLGVKLHTKSFNVSVLHREKKEGLGKAYIYAFHKILEKKFDYILQMDADLSHDPKYIPKFLDATNEADFVVGSRYVKGGGTPDWKLIRRILSQGGNLYTRSLLGSKITDYTGGYNLYAADLLRSIGLDSLEAGGYGFLIELKFMALSKAAGIKQVPIIFMDRQHGSSKIPKNTLLKNFLLVPQVRRKNKQT